ncbi:MAG: wax ester/triacylglycerol synthase family O-acyltransferase, partial [Bacteroidetes bacterium]
MLSKIAEKLIQENLQPVSGMDATFLYTETPTSPMNIGSVVIIEGSIDFKTFRDTVYSRIHHFPKLRQRLLYVPMSIDHPYWVDDPNFDIDLHLRHTALPQPGSWKELRRTASQYFSEPLEMSRPLWSMTFVEGLDEIPQVPKGSIAIISKIHHVAVDGIGGAGLLSLFLDFSDKEQDIPAPEPYHPRPLPNELTLLLNSTLSFAKNPLKLPKLFSELVTATVKAGFLTRIQKTALPTAPFTAPATPLNGIISARRLWNSAILSLDRILNLKKIMGTTMNDVMLTICAGALRRYLDEKGKLPNKSLVAMVPVSMRNGDDNGSGFDNQISAMLVQIATQIADPIARLETIHENTSRGKTYQGGLSASSLAKMAEAIPFGIANQAAHLYSRFHVSTMHKPVFNVAITNVPGPKIPLYINGHKMIAVMGSAPIIDGMGLIITILSYNGYVTVSPFSDAKSMPDLDTFTRYIWESANELEAAILAHQEKQAKKTPTRRKKPASAKLFTDLGKFLKAMPDNGKPKSGVFQFRVTGDVASEWIVDISQYPGKVTAGKTPAPDATFTIAEEHLLRIVAGEL